MSYDRAAKLAAHGYGSTAILDEATKAFEIARAQVRNAQLQVLTNSPGGSDYVMVETQLNQARTNVATAEMLSTSGWQYRYCLSNLDASSLR